MQVKINKNRQNFHRFLKFSLFYPLYDFRILVQIYQSIIQFDWARLTQRAAAKMLSRRCQNSQKSENTQTSKVNCKFFSKSFQKHDTPLQLLGIHYSSTFYKIPFYHFLFSRYLGLTKRHFSSDIFVPFPDSSDLYSRVISINKNHHQAARNT